MIIHKSLLTVLILILPALVFAQQARPAPDYTKADSLALVIKYDHDVYSLTKALTTPFADPVLKVRAIFRWITENISYDVKFYNRYYYRGKEPKSFSCSGDSMECELRKTVWETDYINRVLDNKKAVCQGFSMLFKKMCTIAGIESEVVPGYVRTQYYEVGTPGNDDHAWNTVRLNTVDYLVDATWAAGGCTEEEDGKLVLFQKYFNDYYWLTPAAEFAKNHFPEDAKWVLLSHYTKENFSANPYYAPDEVGKIKLISPQSGILDVKKGDTIHFKLEYTGELRILQINTNIFQNPDIWYWNYITNRKKVRVLDTFAIKKQQYIQFAHNGSQYIFNYVVKDNSLYYLELIFDTKRVMRFKINVHY